MVALGKCPCSSTSAPTPSTTPNGAPATPIPLSFSPPTSMPTVGRQSLYRKFDSDNFESTQSFLTRFSQSKLSIESELARCRQSSDSDSKSVLKTNLEKISISIAKENGFSGVILTAKHHDGFCLWPSQYIDYSVRSSPWKLGNGDVVRELAEAAENAGVELGIYLLPWDRHDLCYGETIDYNEYYLGQTND